MKHIIFGGFDYAVIYEMDQDAIFNGIDYFVETNKELIGTTYLGKPIKDLSALLEEDLNDVLVLIGSIVYKTELEIQLKELGLVEDKNYMWAIAFTGDKECSRLWNYVEWSDRRNNAENLRANEEGEFAYERYRVATSLIDWTKCNTVVDLGAANERVRGFIPTGIEYIPVDYVKYTEHTLVKDFNKYEFPELQRSSEGVVFIAIGIVRCCKDWKWLFDCIARNADCLILGHDDFPRVSREYRRTHWCGNNALFDHQIIRYMQGNGFWMTDSLDFRLKTTLYKFEKRK